MRIFNSCCINELITIIIIIIIIITIIIQVLQCTTAIVSADSAAKKAELEAMEMTWDGEVRIVSKYYLELTYSILI